LKIFVSAITLEEQLDATTGVVASRNRSRLHRLAGASPAAANLRPEPAAISSDLFLPLALGWNRGSESLLLLLLLLLRVLVDVTGWFLSSSMTSCHS